MRYLLLAILVLSVSCLNEKQQAEMILRHYIDKNTELIRNYAMESKVALWNLNLSGNERDYKKLIALELDFNNSNQNNPDHFAPDRFTTFTRNVFTNEQDFKLLRRLKNSGLVTDTLLKRQLSVLYQSFMGPQVEAERYKKVRFAETKLWQSFLGVEVVWEGRKYKGSQLDSLRSNANDRNMLKMVHEAYREKARQIAGDIVAMVKMRNELARDFGYTDYYQLALETKDQTPEKIISLLREIGEETDQPFFETKTTIDKLLAKRYHLPVTDLRSYHYNDERRSYLPLRFSQKMDSLYREKDPVQLAAAFFEGIGLPVQEVIDRSDLKFRKGKSSGTSVYNIDFSKDIRMMSTIYSNTEGMKKMMHLCGHASHMTNIRENIPYLLKDPNSVVTEGIASFFENLPSNSSWLKGEFGLDEASNQEFRLLCMHYLQVDRLFRFRRLLVKSLFEREIYRDPDQNLGELWYRLNEKYLGITPPNDPEPSDWATSGYFTSFSCTVHNFVLADLFAGQLQHYLEMNILNAHNSQYQHNRAIGNFLVEKVYQYGDLLPWEQLIVQATGEPLNPLYLANYLSGDHTGETATGNREPIPQKGQLANESAAKKRITN
jgi:peptidyl-dipeptidase A